MIPIMQTIFHAEGQAGNCMQAAVASLFELPLEDVPHFFEDAIADDGVNGWNRFRQWFKSLGIYPRQTMIGIDEAQPAWDFPHLVSGISPRGLQHMVVHQGLDMIHDPHPEGGGVIADTIWELLVCDPALHAKAFGYMLDRLDEALAQEVMRRGISTDGRD